MREAVRDSLRETKIQDGAAPARSPNCSPVCLVRPAFTAFTHTANRERGQCECRASRRAASHHTRTHTRTSACHAPPLTPSPGAAGSLCGARARAAVLFCVRDRPHHFSVCRDTAPFPPHARPVPTVVATMYSDFKGKAIGAFVFERVCLRGLKTKGPGGGIAGRCARCSVFFLCARTGGCVLLAPGGAASYKGGLRCRPAARESVPGGCGLLA
jgi:hypothetical protein